jgi:RND family efflux transporter MFP subunit
MTAYKGGCREVNKLRTVFAWAAAAGILLLGFAWLAGWFNDRTPPGLESLEEQGAVEVRTTRVESSEEQTFLPVPGRLWAARRTRITSELPGKITELLVRAGQGVEAGTVLVELDRTELAARVDRIRKQVPAREARLEEAQADFERYKALVEDGAVPVERFETARRALEEAEAASDATRERLVEAEEQLDETSIEATLNGTVVDPLAKVGEVAQPGQPLLEIYQPATLRLECAVPESLAGRLQVGQRLRAGLGAEQQTVEVTIDDVVPQADAASRTRLVKARVPDPEAHWEGRYGRLWVPLGSKRKLSLPAEAIQSVGQLDFVHVLAEGRERERRFVQRGIGLPQDRVEILSGLEAGERVVLGSTDTPNNESNR